jgi:hypothetical protein
MTRPDTTKSLQEDESFKGMELMTPEKLKETGFIFHENFTLKKPGDRNKLFTKIERLRQAGYEVHSIINENVATIWTKETPQTSVKYISRKVANLVRRMYGHGKRTHRGKGSS